MIRVLLDEEAEGVRICLTLSWLSMSKMCFQFFPLSDREKANEWSKCVIPIKESNSRLKNKPQKQKPVD